jgi:RNA polymerase sigma-70 factor (ECF subfamily)
MHHWIFDQQVLPAKDKMFRFALRLLENTEDARDAVQDVLLRIWKDRERLEEVKNPEAWCMQITKNHCLDRLKALRVKRKSVQKIAELEDGIERQTPYKQAEQQDEMKTVRKVISELPEKSRMVIQLREVEGFTYQEISEILEWSMDEVKVNLFRARKKLKEILIKNKTYGLS